MLIEVDKSEWDDSIEVLNLSLMFKSKYLEIVSKSFNTQIQYLLLKDSNSIAAAICVFYKNKKVYCPDNFTYTPLWLNDTYSERKKNEFLEAIIKYLKTNFRKITLKLSPDIKDIRAFKWQNFNVEPRYTYLRFKDANYHKSIKARLNRGVKILSEVLVRDTTSDDINLNIRFLNQLKTQKRNLIYNENFLNNLNEAGFLESFNIDIEGVPICSFIILLDKIKKVGYTLMINGADRDNEYYHALIYKQMLAWFDENDYDYVDFCGANMQGISKFKSFFNPQLQVYFLVKFSRLQNFLNPILFLIKNL